MEEEPTFTCFSEATSCVKKSHYHQPHQPQRLGNLNNTMTSFFEASPPQTAPSAPQRPAPDHRVERVLKSSGHSKDLRSDDRPVRSKKWHVRSLKKEPKNSTGLRAPRKMREVKSQEQRLHIWWHVMLKYVDMWTYFHPAKASAASG